MFFDNSDPLEGARSQRRAFYLKEVRFGGILTPRREPGHKEGFLMSKRVCFFVYSDPPRGSLATRRMIFEVFGVHMGRYGLRFRENGSYINYLAIGINFGLKFPREIQ